jgi:hypothetical protein
MKKRDFAPLSRKITGAFVNLKTIHTFARQINILTGYYKRNAFPPQG